MRTKRVLKNAIASIMLQVLVALSGFILPRYYITFYGSEVNGLILSIGQFITYMGLVEAGVNAAGMVALFRPLADKNNEEISGVVSAVRRFYYKSGAIFVGLIILLVIIYPLLINNEMMNPVFCRRMILILSINGIVDFFYLGKYRVLLQADQREYIISFIQSVGTVIMTFVCIVQINLGCTALIVRETIAIIYVLRALAVGRYVKKKYPDIRFNAKPDFQALGQRWSALLHHIVGMIVLNTDIVLLTLMLPEGALVQISIYNVYNLVAFFLNSLLNSIFKGLGSGLGEILAKKEEKSLEQVYSNYEYLFFITTFVLYGCMAVLLYPFVCLYAKSFSDGAVYQQWSLVLLFTLSGFLRAIRIPALTIIGSGGHYQQTQGRAILEAIINLSVSICLVRHLGICGVLIGTCMSYLYRSTDTIVYASTHFCISKLRQTVSRIIRNSLITVPIVWGLVGGYKWVNDWTDWILFAIMSGLILVVSLVMINLMFEPKEGKKLLNGAKRFFK